MLPRTIPGGSVRVFVSCLKWVSSFNRLRLSVGWWIQRESNSQSLLARQKCYHYHYEPMFAGQAYTGSLIHVEDLTNRQRRVSLLQTPKSQFSCWIPRHQAIFCLLADINIWPCTALERAAYARLLLGSITPKMVAKAGFEPTISSLWG